MNSHNHSKTTISFFIALSLTCFALLPKANATPDPTAVGGIRNTADGSGALSVTTGSNNSAFGFRALNHDSSGSGNTATGYGALYTNNAGSYNTAVGETALYSNSSGTRNTAVGDGALLANATASSNTAVGVSALRNNVNGNYSTAVGHDALSQNNASDNTALGYQALLSNSSGIDNTATGFQALFSNTTGYFNTAVGAGSLFHSNGLQNTAVGNGALYRNSTGAGNTAIGFKALFSNTTGGGNVAIGGGAGQYITGTSNVAIGPGAGLDLTGSYNVCIGWAAYGAAGVDGGTWISNTYNSIATGRAVYVNSDDRIGTLSSSRRYKEEIQAMDKTSETLFALKPVTFRYKKEIDPARALSFGLIAEDVADINSDLVTRDKQGNPESVRYEAVNAMLLNEFLREHKRVQELESRLEKQNGIIAQQQKGMETLKAELKEQAALIQKVSALLTAASPSRGGLEMSKAAPRMAASNR